MSLEDFNENLTYEKKTTYGIIGIVIGIFFWVIILPHIELMDIVLLILPCIFLAMPSQITKNNNCLAITSTIVIMIAFLILIFVHFNDTLSQILQLILCLYGFFCAYLMTIPTGPKKLLINSSNINVNNNQNFEEYCSECGQCLFNNAQFCSKCGARVTKDVQEDDSLDIEKESNENVCSECGKELYEDSKFCQECGVRVTKDVQEDDSLGIEKESNENVCGECGEELYENSKFCPKCGAEVVVDIEDSSSQDDDMDSNENVCGECGSPLKTYSKFCPVCGAKVTASDEETHQIHKN